MSLKVDQQVESTETEPTETYITKSELNSILNKALDQRNAKMFSKLESKLVSLLGKGQEELVEDEEETSPNEVISPKSKVQDFGKFELALKRERKARQELENRLVQEKVNSQISNNIRGKVSEQWLDVATDMVKKHVKIESGTPVLDFDGDTYDIEDGLKQWLSKDCNKRFLPPPVTTKTQHREPANLINSSEEDRIRMIQDRLNIPDFLTSE
jgi:hypothetical protein